MQLASAVSRGARLGEYATSLRSPPQAAEDNPVRKDSALGFACGFTPVFFRPCVWTWKVGWLELA
jgi:hypothetical protein